MVTVKPRDGITDLHVEEQIEMAGWRIFAPGWGAGAGAIFGLAIAAMLGMQEEAILLLALPSAVFGAMATVKGMVNTKAQNASPQVQRVLDRPHISSSELLPPSEAGTAGFEVLMSFNQPYRARDFMGFLQTQDPEITLAQRTETLGRYEVILLYQDKAERQRALDAIKRSGLVTSNAIP